MDLMFRTASLVKDPVALGGERLTRIVQEHDCIVPSRKP